MSEALERVHDSSLERVTDEQANKQALRRIKSNPKNHPLSSIIPEPLAAKVESWFDGYAKLYPETRVAILAVIRFTMTEGNWAKSKKAMCIELGFKTVDVDYWGRKWPYLWPLANELSRFYADQALGRVLGATTDAAIYGDSRDRRLYFEVFGHIKQEQKAGSGVNITFHCDNLNRPPAFTIEAKKVGSESEEL